MTQPLLVASKLPIKTLVARQLPTNVRIDLFHSHLTLLDVFRKLGTEYPPVHTHQRSPI